MQVLFETQSTTKLNTRYKKLKWSVLVSTHMYPRHTPKSRDRETKSSATETKLNEKAMIRMLRERILRQATSASPTAVTAEAIFKGWKIEKTPQLSITI